MTPGTLPPSRTPGHGGPLSTDETLLSERLRAYLEGLTVTQGGRIGKPFGVMPWQAEALALFDTPGSVAVTMARKNGKTTLFGGVLAAAVDGPLGFPAPT